MIYLIFHGDTVLRAIKGRTDVYLSGKYTIALIRGMSCGTIAVGLSGGRVTKIGTKIYSSGSGEASMLNIVTVEDYGSGVPRFLGERTSSFSDAGIDYYEMSNE